MKYGLLLILAVCLLSPAAVWAQAKPYFGGSIGASFYDTELEDVSGDDFKLDGEEFAWKIFGGFRGVRLWAIEGGYVNFGKVQNASVRDLRRSGPTGAGGIARASFIIEDHMLRRYWPPTSKATTSHGDSARRSAWAALVSGRSSSASSWRVTTTS